MCVLFLSPTIPSFGVVVSSHPPIRVRPHAFRPLARQSLRAADDGTDKTASTPAPPPDEPQSLAEYLLPYAGGVLVALILGSAAFYTLVTSS
jgi:hypothetical protein